MNFPTKKYDIIYCDPAWTYNDKALAGKRGAECKYNVMSLQELKDLRVESISNENSIMFMWVTFPKLIDGTCIGSNESMGVYTKDLCI